MSKTYSAMAEAPLRIILPLPEINESANLSHSFKQVFLSLQGFCNFVYFMFFLFPVKSQQFLSTHKETTETPSKT